MLDQTSRVVIVGAGQGGLQAAMSLRQEGFEGAITLIGEEPSLPYQRPPLSKAYLKSGVADTLTLRPETFFEKNDITVLSGTRVDEIDRSAGCVWADGQRVDYDHLVLAMGTRNMRPPLSGVEHALDLRTLADATQLRSALTKPRCCAVIGAGFIGLEFAAVARTLGHEVTVAEAAPRPMARAISVQMSQRFTDLHEDMGTRLCFDQPVKAVDPDGIHLPSGEKVAADLILLAAGVRPNVELAEGAGLPCDNGVIVNAMLLTSDPAISALGDCAAFPDPRTGRQIRLESVQAACDHARNIAKRLAKGDADSYNSVPWFWSDQSDYKLQIAGLAAPDDDAVVREDGAVLRFAGNVLTAVETINNAKTHMTARRLLAQDTPPGRDSLEQTNCQLSLE